MNLYTQDGPEQNPKFIDAKAKVVYCKHCKTPMLVREDDDVEDCGRHKGNVTILSRK